jgi:3D (Asp-Asp-Asp) domain-containing protein
MFETLRDPGRVKRNDIALAWYSFSARARSLVHRRFGSAALLLFALSITVTLLIHSMNFYLVRINGRMNSFISLSDNLRQVLADKGYEIKESDILRGDLEAQNGFAYATYEQSYPVTVSVGTNRLSVSSFYGESVLSVLNSAGIKLHALDEVTPSLMSAASENMVIEVIEKKPENNVINKDAVLSEAALQLAKQQKAAQEKTAKEAALKAVTSSHAGSAVFYSPAANLLPVEQEGNILSTKDGKFSYIAKFNGVCTAYSSGTHTATGTRVHIGSVAVDPKVIPLGSKLYIVSADGKSWMYGTAVAEDTGGAVKGNIVDLYMPGYTDCINFGRRKALIYILE